MTDQSLDSILSGKGETAPAPDTETKETETTQATETTEAAESETAETQESDGQKTVPLAALHAEKQKAKRYTEQIADFEKRIGESNAAWERRFTQLLERLTPQQQQPEQKPDFFADPEAATRGIVSPHIQQVQNLVYANAREVANGLDGEDKVLEAQAAFDAARANGSLDPADYHKVMNSPNPFRAAVRWHKRTSVLKEIGDDPEKYRERVKAEILAELQSNGHQPNGGERPAPVMPTNLATARNVGSRSGPAWSGPPSLNDIFDRKSPAA